jgi:bifunctional DNA primase/polymerase-like protein
MPTEETPGLVLAKLVASWGGRVVPAFCTKSGEKIPLGGTWTETATRDVEQLERWWTERPWCWVGLVTGSDSLIAFDIDGPEGVDWFRALCTREGWPSGCLAYKTPGRSGGMHCVLSWPDFLGRDFRQAKVYCGGGEVQLRGNGHFILLAGARRPDIPERVNNAYEIISEPMPGSGVGLAPERLLRAFLRESVVSVGPSRTYSRSELSEISPEKAWVGRPYVRDAAEPGRKNTLAGLAWYLAIRGGSLVDVMDVCVRFGAECCEPPLSEELCERKAKDAVNKAEKYRRRSLAETERIFKLWRFE